METIKIKSCWICGKNFPIRIRDDGLILTLCFHSYMCGGKIEYWECPKCCKEGEESENR